MTGPGAIVVLGAGLIGCFVGGRLTIAGPVALLGRDALVEEIAQNGLWFSERSEIRTAARPEQLRVTSDPGALAGAELILVCVKSAATADAAAAIAAHAPHDAPIISFQNGVGNVELLRSALPGRTVLAGMVPFNVARRAAGHFHKGTAGDLVVQSDPSLDRWIARFAAAGLPIVPASDMAGVAWGKLVINLNNAVNALSGLPLAAQLADRDFRRAWSMAQREALALLKVAGIVPAPYNGRSLRLLAHMLVLPDALFNMLNRRGTGRVDRHARSSMADDLAGGRLTEVDYINGAVVALAMRLGRPAPVNECLVSLVHAAERGATPWTGPALRQHLERMLRVPHR